MSEERERNDPGRHTDRVTDRVVDRQGEGEPDFEGHANRGGDQVTDRVVDRQGEGEPDFEGHRHIERNIERNEP